MQLDAWQSAAPSGLSAKTEFVASSKAKANHLDTVPAVWWWYGGTPAFL